MTIRWMVFVLYLAIVYYIGFANQKKSSSSLDEFYVAGRKLGPFPLAGTFCASYVSAAFILGIMSLAYSNGVGAITINGLGFGGGWTLLTLMSKKLQRFEGVTSPDIYAMRYESKVLRTWTAFLFAFNAVLFLVIQFKGIGTAVSGFLNIPNNLAILLIGGTIIFYVSTGGMKSVVWTDVIQAIIMITGVYLTAMLIAGKFGIPDIITQAGQLAEEGKRAAGYMLDPFAGGVYTPLSAFGTTFSLCAAVACVTFYHRMFFSARSIKAAKATTGVAAPFLIVFFFCIVFLGITGKVLVPNLASSDQVFPMLVNTVLGPTIGTIVLTCIVATIMSTVDSQLLAVGAIVSHDFYRTIINKNADTKKELHAVRLGIIIIGGLGMLIAILNPSQIMVIYYILNASIAATLFPMLILGLFWKSATAIGAIVGSVAGFITSWVWYAFFVKPTGIPTDLVAVPVAFALTIIVSLFTKRTSRQALAIFFEDEEQALSAEKTA